MALVILLIISIACTSVEGARVESANARCSQITYMALDSCFSGFGREIFEDYGLMMLWDKEEQFLDDYEKYIDKNCNYRKDMISKTADFLKIDYSKSDLISISTPMEGDGELIERQICDYMKLASSEVKVEEVVSNSNILIQNEGIREFTEKINDCVESSVKVEECIKNIYEISEELKKYESNQKKVLLEMKNCITVIDSVFSDTKIEVDTNEEYKNFILKYNEFTECISLIDKQLKEIMIITNDYLVNTSEAMDKINCAKSYIALKKEDYSDEMLSPFLEEINDIELQILEHINDKFNVVKSRDNVIKQRKIIYGIKQKFENVDKNIKDNKSLFEISDNEKFIKDISVMIDESLMLIEEFKTYNIGINYVKKTGKEQKNEIAEFAEKIKSDGVINYIVKEDVSNKKVNIKNLPSNKCRANKGENWKNYSDSEETIRKVMVIHYIFNKFNCYTNKNEGECLNYEIEYVLKGKESDKENLCEVIDEIMRIREAFNLVCILRDSDKRSQAYNMATVIAGFTGRPVVIKFTQMLIMVSWAYAESVIDVKELLEGKRVSVVKASDEWNLSLTKVKSLEPKKNKKENSKGLLYEDYLRVLLFSQNKAIQIYRILDVIELNTSKKYNQKFKIRDCIVKVNIKSEYKVNRLFTEIGFIKRMINNKNKGFVFKINQEYGYCY